MHEQQDFFAELGGGHSAHVFRAESGLPESTTAERPMGTRNSQHGAVLDDSQQHAIEQAAKNEAGITAGGTAHMDGVRKTSRTRLSRRSKTAQARHLGFLGAYENSQAGEVRSEALPSSLTIHLRAVDTARLLNSTPLGTVINERQLYRHRMRSGDGFMCGRKVDFIAYAAWLFNQKHSDSISPAEAQSISFRSVQQLLRRQQYRCALSGRELTPTTAALDHIVAISRGGGHSIENAQVLHRDVNRAKNVMGNEEFVALCRDVVAWADSQTREYPSSEDQNHE